MDKQEEVWVTLDEDLAEQLQALAKKANVPFEEYVALRLKECWLQQLKPKDGLQ